MLFKHFDLGVYRRKFLVLLSVFKVKVDDFMSCDDLREQMIPDHNYWPGDQKNQVHLTNVEGDELGHPKVGNFEAQIKQEQECAKQP